MLVDELAAEDVYLIRGMLIGLHVLWRLPARLRPGRAPLAGEDRASAEWEIDLVGAYPRRHCITSLWCLDADNANLFAW